MDDPSLAWSAAVRWWLTGLFFRALRALRARRVAVWWAKESGLYRLCLLAEQHRQRSRSDETIHFESWQGSLDAGHAPVIHYA